MSYDFYITRIILAILVSLHPQLVHSNRPSHGLVFMTEESMNTYQFDDGTTLTVRPGEILYLPKYSTYSVTLSPAYTGCYAINFDLAEDIVFPPFVFNPKNKSNFLDHFKKAERIWKTKKQGYEMKCTIELLYIINDMQSEYMADYIDKKKLDILSPALTYIHDNYANELISIPKLSALCDIGPAYFRKLFKQAYGISPIKYINNLKISRAKELLSSGMYTVTQAAEMSGYTDVSHFSREFKKATGAAPSMMMSSQPEI